MALIRSSSRTHRSLLAGGTVLALALAVPAGAALASTTQDGTTVKARAATQTAAVKARVTPRVKARTAPAVKARSVTTAARVKARTGTRLASTAPTRPSDAGHGPRSWPWGAVVHGQVTLDTRDGGVRSVTLQRGVVTAVADGTVTVRSADGFLAVWTFDPSVRIWVHGHQGVVGDLAVDATVGLTGSGPTQAPTASLVIVTGGRRATPTDPPAPTDPPTPTAD